MSGFDDYDNEMFRHPPLDDAAIDTFFTGQVAGDELAPLAGFVEDVRSMTSGPAPAPSVQLASMLADGISVESVPVPAPPATSSSWTRKETSSSWTRKKKVAVAHFVAGLSLIAKAALGITAAAAAVTAGGAVGVLPDPAQRAVSTGLEAVTPFSFPDEASDKAEFGGTVSTDASDGGVDGPTVSSEAKLNADANRPPAPGQNGLDQANTTPAAGHAPTAVPGGPPASAGAPGSTGLARAGDTPAAAHLPTSVPAGPPASTPPAETGPQGTPGGATVSSTPAAGRVPAAVPPASPGRP
jgi:hypothetical protein